MAEDVREMSGAERYVWGVALSISRTGDRTADERLDALCRMANDYEDASLRAEYKGKHDTATECWRLSELLDVAARALI